MRDEETRYVLRYLIHVTTLLNFFWGAVIHLPPRVMMHHHLRPYVSFQEALIEVMVNVKF
jgi:hypothetical protein